MSTASQLGIAHARVLSNRKKQDALFQRQLILNHGSPEFRKNKLQEKELEKQGQILVKKYWDLCDKWQKERKLSAKRRY